jgi:hypothetical protein
MNTITISSYVVEKACLKLSTRLKNDIKKADEEDIKFLMSKRWRAPKTREKALNILESEVDSFYNMRRHNPDFAKLTNLMKMCMISKEITIDEETILLLGDCL